jgi:exosortase/archaeosortase family protein
MGKRRKKGGERAKQLMPERRSDRAARGDRVAPRQGRDTKGAERSWFWSKRPILRFVLLFCVLMAVFEGLCAVPVARDHLFPGYLRINARGAAAILRLLGTQSTVNNLVMSSASEDVQFEMEVRRGCDAVDPSLVFLSAILAFPGRIRTKIPGMVIGTSALMLINFVRIVSLFLVGVYFPSVFELMHVDVWQVAFIFLAILFWVIWAARVSLPGVVPADASETAH